MSAAPTPAVTLAPIAVTPQSGAGFWRDAWRRFRRKPPAMVALIYVVALGLVTAAAPAIVGTRPIVCRYHGRLYFPSLYYFHPSLENPIFRRDRFRIPFYKSLQQKDPDRWAVFPLVYMDPERRVSKEEVDTLRPPRRANPAGGTVESKTATGEDQRPQTEPTFGEPFGEPFGSPIDAAMGPMSTEPETDDGPPNRYHWLGVTNATRIDVFAIMVHGAKIAMLIGFVTTGIAATIGISLGAVAGYAGGWIDLVISRLTEFFMSIPVLILIIALLAVIDKPSIWHIMVVLGVTGWTHICRLTRAEFLKLRSLDYVTAARAQGAGVARILFRHILPNAMAPVLVPITFGIATAILIESGLSLLGLGAPPDTPSWGALLNRGRENFETMWWLILFPGLAIFTTVLAYNLIGEGLQEATDPRLRESAK